MILRPLLTLKESILKELEKIVTVNPMQGEKKNGTLYSKDHYIYFTLLNGVSVICMTHDA
jgi:hypothetical protein